MGTIADKLAYLSATKTAIKNAIVAKGVDVPDGTPFRQYADKVGEISGSKTAEVSISSGIPSGYGSIAYGIDSNGELVNMLNEGTYTLQVPCFVYSSSFRSTGCYMVLSGDAVILYEYSAMRFEDPDLSLIFVRGDCSLTNNVV